MEQGVSHCQLNVVFVGHEKIGALLDLLELIVPLSSPMLKRRSPACRGTRPVAMPLLRIMLHSRSRSSLWAPDSPRVVAVDWSGRSGPDQKRWIWLAEATGGELVRLESGRSRTEVVDWLIAQAHRDPNLITGMDFAFSLPAWYLRDRELTARDLWAVLADESLTPAMEDLGLARWLKEPEPPFWSRSKADAGLTRAQEYRRTDDVARAAGTQAKSVFQLVGAGQVGRGSLYGMQALHRLAGAGFRIWPFQPSRLPVVVEVYPRLLTGPITKSSPAARARYLASASVPKTFRGLAAASEDAFDAAVSALGMAAAVQELSALPGEPDYALEGKIWPPDMRAWRSAHARS